MKNKCKNCNKTISQGHIRCRSCAGKVKTFSSTHKLNISTSKIGNKNALYKNGTYCQNKKCIDCGIHCSSGALRCRSCAEKIKNKGDKNGNYKKIGSWRISGGYKYIKIADNKWQQEHIYMVEKYTNRKMQRFENIHHIDGDKLHNVLSNFYIFKKASLHLAFEYLIRNQIIDRFILKSNLDQFRSIV